MIKKILVAIDDSRPAVAATLTACRLGMQLDAGIAVLHVVDIASALIPELGISDEKELARLRRAGADLLNDAPVPPSIHPERIMAEGAPADMIVNTAREWGADLIVIGSDSRGRLSHFLIGSTADSVIRRASCPVVTVRMEDEKQRSRNVAAANVA